MSNKSIQLHDMRYEIGGGQFIIYGPNGNELHRHPISELGFSEGENPVGRDEYLYEFAVIFPDGNSINFRERPNLADFAEAFKKEKGASNKN